MHSTSLETYLGKDADDKEMHDKSKIDKNVEKFLKRARDAGFEYTARLDDASSIDIVLGAYKEDRNYYHIGLRNTALDGKEMTWRIYVEQYSKKGAGSIEDKLTEYYPEKPVSVKSKNVFDLLLEAYNSKFAGKNDGLPEIKKNNLGSLPAYAFTAGYGATILSYLDNSPVATSHSYGIWKFGVLAAGAAIPMIFNKKIRSLKSLASLSLVGWAANSIFYYPIGMLMGHVSVNPTDVINWYKFQARLGSGYYIDYYGSMAVKVTSASKTASYAGRLALAGVLAKWNSMTMKRKEAKKNGEKN